MDEHNHADQFWIRFKKGDKEIMLVISDPFELCDAMERMLQANGIRYTRTQLEPNKRSVEIKR